MADTILLIDDDPHLLHIAEMLFQLDGYNVVTAKSGELALETLTQLRPHLILLDVMMPGIDGLEVLRQVRANPKLKGVPVAVFSAAELRDQELREAGADDFIVKPYSVEGLQNTVRELIDKAARNARKAPAGSKSKRR